MERKYVAFISYRHAQLDSAVAKQLHTLIEQYVIPKNLRKDGKKRLGLVFRDQEELPVSSDLSDDICRALDHSQYLIVICSKDTAASPWVGREIAYFLSHHDRQCAFAALVSGEPGDVFPVALTRIEHPDGTATDVEPLAIDVRAESIPAMKKKLKREISRLYAALIGCPYDALVMREQRRKRRRLAAVMAVVLAVVTSFSAMTLVKNYQIDQKNEELAGMNQTLEDKNLELEEKNDELARQKAEVQLRESELLTEKGLTDLANNDRQSAIENLLAALPSEEDRPYYALAEQGLISALGIYAEDKTEYEVFDTVIEQKVPIEDYVISPDGTRIMTLDSYGVVNCFSAATGSSLWSSQINDSSYADDFQLINYPEGDGALVRVASNVAKVEWDTGRILWNSYSYGSQERVYVTDDCSLLAYRKQEFTADLTNYSNGVTILSADTGEELLCVDMGLSSFSNDEEGDCCWAFSSMFGADYMDCVFSSDNRLLAASHIEQTPQGDYRCYMLIDYVTGELRQLAREKLDTTYGEQMVFRLYFADDNTSLISVARSRGGSSAFHVEKYDIETGRKLWKMDTPEEENEYYFSSLDKMFTHMGETILVLCRGDRIYVIDQDTGKLHNTCELEAPLAAFDWVDEYFMSLILENGRNTLAWSNDYGIYLADMWYTPSLNLGQTAKARLWNEGLLRMIVEDNTIQRMDVATADKNYGYVVTQPEEAGVTLEVKRTVYLGDLLETEKTELIDEERQLFEATVIRTGNYLILGRYSDSLSSACGYSYKALDLRTHDTEALIPLEAYVLEENIFFPSDLSGYITNEASQISYHKLDGGVELLAQNSTSSYSENENLVYYDYLYASANQTADGRLLTAELGNDTLSWWLDGKDKTTLEIPEDICSKKIIGTSSNQFMMVSKTGYILVADYGVDGDGYVDRFAAYNIHTGQWYRFADTVSMTDAFVSTGSQKPWMLINDATNTVSIYDIPTNTLLYQFPLQLTMNSVSQIKLVAEDRYVAVLTKDVQVFLYDIETGQIVYNRQMEGYTGDMLYVEFDPVNERLYLWDSSAPRDGGFCVDVNSWTELARIPGLIYYNPDTNELYCYNYERYDNIYIMVFQAPSLEELMGMGEAILAQ